MVPVRTTASWCQSYQHYEFESNILPGKSVVFTPSYKHVEGFVYFPMFYVFVHWWSQVIETLEHAFSHFSDYVFSARRALAVTVVYCHAFGLAMLGYFRRGLHVVLWCTSSRTWYAVRHCSALHEFPTPWGWMNDLLPRCTVLWCTFDVLVHV